MSVSSDARAKRRIVLSEDTLQAIEDAYFEKALHECKGDLSLKKNDLIVNVYHPDHFQEPAMAKNVELSLSLQGLLRQAFDGCETPKEEKAIVECFNRVYAWVKSQPAKPQP
jgi:hypothetical protein